MDGSAANAELAWSLAIPADTQRSERRSAASPDLEASEAIGADEAPPATRPTPATPAADDDTSLQTTSAIARGDTEAFAQFYEIWFDRMVHMTRSITGRDESFCLDVTQDAMLRIVRSIRPMATDDDLRRWILRVVHTAALDRLRADARRQRREELAGQSALPGGGGDSGGAVDPDLAEQIARLRAQINTLGPDDRGLLLLRFIRGGTLRTAAEAGGLTTGAAHGRLRRLTRRLREMMEASDES